MFSGAVFKFNIQNNNLVKKDKIILQKIENAINSILNSLSSSISSEISQSSKLLTKQIDFSNYVYIINSKLSLVVKHILNQNNILHFQRTKWCGCKIYNVICFENLLSTYSRMPKIKSGDRNISNNVDIPNSNSENQKINSYKHDMLNPTNKAAARRMHGIYHES